MFNLQGSELIIILLLALVVLGPEKLPDAMRKAGKMYAEVKKMATGFQDEFRAAIDEPVREMRETADVLRDSADLTSLQSGARDEKPKSAEMGDAGATSSHGLEPADPDAVPVEQLPFGPDTSDTADEPDGSDEFAYLPDPDAPEQRKPGADDGDGPRQGEPRADDGDDPRQGEPRADDGDDPRQGEPRADDGDDPRQGEPRADDGDDPRQGEPRADDGDDRSEGI